MKKICSRCRKIKEFSVLLKSECDQCAQSRSAYRARNRDSILAYQRNYYHNAPMQKEKVLAKQTQRRRANGIKPKRLGLSDEDWMIQKQIRETLRSRLKKVLRGGIRASRAMELLGCTIDEFKIYLARKFQLGMTMFNHGSVWHIDHIRPCSSFNLADLDQQKQCFHFTNLQPLFAMQNLYKGGINKRGCAYAQL